MRRLTTLCAVPLLTFAIAGCGKSEAPPLLPAAVALSPDGVRHEQHSFSPDGKRIAYWSPSADTTGRMQLWVANADLSSPMKLPVSAADSALAPPAWSPDGASLAVPSSDFGWSQVVIVPSAGGSVRRVTEGTSIKEPLSWFRSGQGLNYWGSAPGGVLQSFIYWLASGESRPLVPAEKRSHLGAASPDGSHVAYFIIDGGKVTIWVADGNGGNPRQLTTEGFESTEQYEEWSPDSKEVLYLSRRTGHTDLWIVPIDSGKARQLTRDIRDDYSGAWSSDGKWIAFLSNRGRQTDVWVVPAAGGPEQRVTDTPLEEVAPLKWRPGTHTLTFGVRAVRGGLWAMDLADGRERRLTPDEPQISVKDVSRDGKQLLYVIERGGGIEDLAMMPLAGGESRIVIAGGGSVLYPRWSPDGQRIAFSSDRGGTTDIWVVDAAAGATPRQLTDWPGYEWGPNWTHDGSEIYFSANKDAKLYDVWRIPSAGGDAVRVTKDGNLGSPPLTIKAQPGFFAATIAKAGQFALLRFGPDGTSNVVWDRSSVDWVNPSPTGDAVVADVEQADGKFRAMMLKADGTGGRPILEPGQRPLWWSKDGQWVLYGFAVGDANELGVLRVADGTTRRLTTTPESEEGAELTPDGKTVLFRRMQTVQRITAVDLSKMLAEKR